MKVAVAPSPENFDPTEYDVSCCCDKLFCGYIKLTLKEDEVDRHTVCCSGLADNKKRIPYGELSGVDKQQVCGCFYTFGGGKLNEGQGPFCPGIGCDQHYVDEIVNELKKRQTARGDAGNIRRVEDNGRRIAIIECKIDALLAHLNVTPEKMQRIQGRSNTAADEREASDVDKS